METIQKAPLKWHEVKIEGNWKIVYVVGNSQGSSAFGGYHLPVYPNPFTGQKTFLKDVDSRALTGHLVDKIQTKLNPDVNGNDKLLISWMICHPEVEVQGVKNLPQQILEKKQTTKIKLICTDFKEMADYESEDYIDKLIGVLSTDMAGKNTITLAKFKYIMAYLNLAYREPRFDATGEKKALRSKLKNFVRSSYENATLVNGALNNLSVAQDAYEFKELVRTKIIIPDAGVYKFDRVPVGVNFEQVSTYFESHPEVKTEALSRLYKIIS